MGEVIRSIKRYFSRKTENQLETSVNRIISGMAKDISNLKDWAVFLHQKQESKHSENRRKVELTRKDLSKITSTTESLQREISQLKGHIISMNSYLFEAHKGYVSLHERLKKVEDMSQGHQRTQERTRQGRIGTQKDAPEVKVIGKEILTASEKRLLDLLYKSEEPLDYQRIARILLRKEKSIRNQIYELRRKGIDIKDCNIGYRKKGFYIGEREKLSISGR